MVDKLQSDNYPLWKGDLIEATKTTTATLTIVEEIIELDSSGGAFTVTLPDIAEIATNKRIWFYDNGNASTNNINIVANGGDGSSIDDGDEYLVDQDNRIVKFELINDRWMATESDVRRLILGAFSFDDNSTVTVISDINTFTDVVGTGVAVSANDGFTFSTPPNILESTFSVTYTALLTMKLTVSRESGNAPRNIAMAVFQDTGSGFTVLSDTVVATTMTASLTNISAQTFVEVSNGDEFKGMIENRDSTDNIIVSHMNFALVRLT